MTALNERFVVDGQGNKVAVVLDWQDYQRVLEELEELESLRAYDAAKVSGESGVPFEQAISEIEKGRE